ncbi:MAG: Na/Pi cotransporter family protein [Rhizobiales bacterium]|nr:Na/Pi cotransporter family protein [Hyphomicrobiales bacterium]MBO6697188.1 Na/Pi cotransporter family protein [Hyphomicrobiales bacterium]MBO6736557.1 Na/Pi cotransporter family protein [Hyphomicrobiales bacterium]MBO6913027.1 Na/Pi cotransporter family protein [Hyphomicrobiales bacterium]MBO6956558.1 Na/Pi cotransporter family protein [Hyphomicrobiales bacterium]
MRKYYLPVAIALILAAFWFSADAQEIAAGVAIFLFGMMMLEDGFKLFSGGTLERMLERTTGSTPRALAFGILSTTILQSSSLVSVITISFLSAGLISLIGGVGIIFGANIGTTTGAWLVAGLGLKVNIASYAMPMIAISIVLVFQKPKPIRGLGYALGGLGFLFLGIHHMKEGFEAFKDQIDLLRFALPGLVGLVVYTLLGTSATVIMQSSHATMVLILTALAAGQITYENALALAIGANVGTTITAILGSLSANFQGKRLALAHLIFNVTTAAVALICIAPLRDIVDQISLLVGIGDQDYALKLAVFHTVFNTLGVALMLPLLTRLIAFLEKRIVEPVPDVSRPRYLNEAVDAFPQTLETALRKEVQHLNENAIELILHGLNLHRQDIYTTDKVAETVQKSRAPMDLDMDEGYERRVKTLYSAIVEFTTRVGERSLEPEINERVHALRDVSGDIVKAVKSVKHLRKNVLRFTGRDMGAVTNLYDGLRTEIARIIVEIHKLESTDPEERSALWLDQERAQIEDDALSTTRRVDDLIRQGKLQPAAATSFLNDSGYAYAAMRNLIEAARKYYIERDSAMAEVERLLSLEDEELDENHLVTDASPKSETADHGNKTVARRT